VDSKRPRLSREDTVIFFQLQMAGVILTGISVVLVLIFAIDKARLAATVFLLGWWFVAALGRSRSHMHGDLSLSAARLRNWTHTGLVGFLVWMLNVWLPQ
jgi:hypothetical protein